MAPYFHTDAWAHKLKGHNPRPALTVGGWVELMTLFSIGKDPFQIEVCHINGAIFGASITIRLRFCAGDRSVSVPSQI